MIRVATYEAQDGAPPRPVDEAECLPSAWRTAALTLIADAQEAGLDRDRLSVTIEDVRGPDHPEYAGGFSLDASEIVADSYEPSDVHTYGAGVR